MLLRSLKPSISVHPLLTMTAAVRVIMRHDTEGEWILADGQMSPCRSGGAWTEPAKENWTILSESPVEMSYKAALSATPLTTAPCSPELGFAWSTSSKKVRAPKEVPVRPASESEDGGYSLYEVRKGRSAGGGSNKSRNNRRK